MIIKPVKNDIRVKRHARMRMNLSGTSVTPRLNVFRSNKHIYAQIIDDTLGKTLAASSTKSLKDIKTTSNIEAAKAVGSDIAAKAKEAGIKNVVFDRGGYLYHGRVKALAEAAREAGLEF